MVDLAAERALELCDELGEWDLAHELLTAELPYGVDPEDEAKAANTQLSPVPAAVTKELEHFVAYRREEFNAHRTGPVVETTTVSGDQATALRFLKYLKEKEGQEQVSLKLFAHAQVGTWTQRYMTWLRGELGLKSSTIAVYCNAILTVATYALTLVPAAERDACELQQLVNLRAQAETLSNREKKFEVKSPHWLSWGEANEARVHAFEAYAKAKQSSDATLAQKRSLLRDCLVPSTTPAQPPPPRTNLPPPSPRPSRHRSSHSTRSNAPTALASYARPTPTHGPPPSAAHRRPAP